MNEQETVRRFLEAKIPESAKSKLEQISGAPVAEGATYHDHLNAKVLQMAKAGDKQAAKLVKQYGLSGSDSGE